MSRHYNVIQYIRLFQIVDIRAEHNLGRGDTKLVKEKEDCSDANLNGPTQKVLKKIFLTRKAGRHLI